MPNRRTRLHFTLLAFLLFPVIARAQSTFGDIRGTARDPAGLVVPQATVTLQNLFMSQPFTGNISNELGQYGRGTPPNV